MGDGADVDNRNDGATRCPDYPDPIRYSAWSGQAEPSWSCPKFPSRSDIPPSAIRMRLKEEDFDTCPPSDKPHMNLTRYQYHQPFGKNRRETSSAYYFPWTISFRSAEKKNKFIDLCRAIVDARKIVAGNLQCRERIRRELEPNRRTWRMELGQNARELGQPFSYPTGVREGLRRALRTASVKIFLVLARKKSSARPGEHV